MRVLQRKLLQEVHNMMIKNAQEAFKSYNNIKEAFLQVKIILFQ